MKIKQIALVLAFAALAICLCGCQSPEITYNQDNKSYTDKSGKTYLSAPACYEPVSYDSEKPYGSLVAGIGKFDLFTIAGTQNGEWLTTADQQVLYLESVTLPTLEQFGVNCVYVCREGEIIHAFARLNTQAEIDEVIKTYLEGESIPYPRQTAAESLRLRMGSDQYPFLYYRLAYLEYASDIIVYSTDENGQEIETNYGKYFLFNRDEDRCVPIGDVIHKYVE